MQILCKFYAQIPGIGLFLDDGRPLRVQRLEPTADHTDLHRIAATSALAAATSGAAASGSVQLVGDARQIAERRVLGVRGQQIGIAHRHQLLQRQIRVGFRIPAHPLFQKSRFRHLLGHNAIN